jgi:uncharacterized membrane protein
MGGQKTARRIVKEANYYYKRYFLVLLITAFIVYGLTYSLGKLSGAVQTWIGLDSHSMQAAHYGSIWLSYFLTIVGLVIATLFALPDQTIGVSANRVMLILYDGKKLAADKVAKEFKQNWLRFLGISAWTTLWNFLWYFAFIIPGIIKSLSYMLAPYLILEYPEMTVRQALKKSMEITKGYKGRLFGIGLLIALPCIITFVTLFIILVSMEIYGTFSGIYIIVYPVFYVFMIEPLSLMAYAIAYKDIKKDAVNRGLLEN